MNQRLRVIRHALVVIITAICAAIATAGCGSESTSSSGKAKRQNGAASQDAGDLIATWREDKSKGQSVAAITFNTGGTAQVTDGCNNGATTYSTKGNRITIKPVAMTMMACIDDKTGASLKQSSLTAQLTDAKFWLIKNDVLTLSDATHKPFARLTRAANK